jgi:hypothetical protein
MATSNESKRIGRDTELRNKLKEASERYESVMGAPLSVDVLKRFLDESEWNNKFLFLRDRIGVLSDADVGFVRQILKVSVRPVPVSEEAVEELSEGLEEVDVADLG